MAGERVAFQGLPARICWLGYGERDKAGVRFNDMVASGELSAPLVIGRDHLDCGSVASPYRETEAMADGSDAIADWPLLNALVNTASGASWVSIHHGGGVGIGRSIHAGQVCVADGTPLAGQKIERVLTNDPGMGVIRHVDAGYELAETVAETEGRTHPDARGRRSRPSRRWRSVRRAVGVAGADRARADRARRATGGYLRYAWTPADLDCREWFIEEALDRDLDVETDGNGNIWATWLPAGVDPRAKAIVTGSHLDSVPHGGAYDGPLGVVSALLAIDEMRAARRDAGAGR